MQLYVPSAKASGQRVFISCKDLKDNRILKIFDSNLIVLLIFMLLPPQSIIYHT